MQARSGARRALALWLRSVAILFVVAVGTGCEPAPVPIVYGEDLCEHCHMVIADRRFGAELVTSTGRVLKFDSVECLAAHVARLADGGGIHSLWVTAFRQPGELIPVGEALFVQSPSLRSPMGAGLGAFGASADTPEALVSELGGAVLDWAQVVERARAS